MKLTVLCVLTTTATVASGLWLIAFRPGGASVGFFALTLLGGALGTHATVTSFATDKKIRDLEARRTAGQEKD